MDYNQINLSHSVVGFSLNISEPLYHMELNPNHGCIQPKIKYSEIDKGGIAFFF